MGRVIRTFLERRPQYTTTADWDTSPGVEMLLTGPFIACLIMAAANLVLGGPIPETTKTWVLEPRDNTTTPKHWFIEPRDGKVLKTVDPDPFMLAEGTILDGAENDEEHHLLTIDPDSLIQPRGGADLKTVVPDPWMIVEEGTIPDGAQNDEGDVPKILDPWQGNDGTQPPGVLN